MPQIPRDMIEREYQDRGQLPEEYEIPPFPVYGGTPSMQMPSEKADLLDKIKPDEIINTFMNRLQGKEKINGKWETINSERALTLKGAWDIANLMLCASNQNVSISKVAGDRDIRRRTESIVGTAIYMCIKNWREYGIKGSDQIHFVKEIVLTTSFFSLKQPEGGSIQSLLKGTTHEQRLVQDQEKKGGWLSGIIRR